MEYFIIGDIHGCYYTMKKLIGNHWQKDNEKLVILGDMVNKGKHTFAVLEYVMALKEAYPHKVTLLKGNNEYLFEKYYRDSITLSAKQKFENYNLDYIQVLNWLNELPHYFENGKVFLSHAGVGVDKKHPENQEDIDVVFNRKKLQNIKKTQFVGHIVVEKATYDESADAWYLDTGAGYGKRLTGAKVDKNGEVKEIISLEVHKKDIAKFN